MQEDRHESETICSKNRASSLCTVGNSHTQIFECCFTTLRSIKIDCMAVSNYRAFLVCLFDTYLALKVK